jgi:hypothetical protein
VVRDWHALGLLALVAVGGCTGAKGTDANPDAKAPVKPTVNRSAAVARRTAVTTSGDSLAGPNDSLQRGQEIDIVRETFAYQGGARDPFSSLIANTSSGPELVDLDLVGIYVDMRAPSNSVVILREKKANGKRYKMRAGDRLGRIRLAQIDDHNAVFMIQDLGFERQETLSLRKQEDATP